MSHNSHTHTDNTHHSEPQLKEWSSKSIFKVSLKALQTTHIQIIQTYAPALLPSAAPKSLGEN